MSDEVVKVLIVDDDPHLGEMLQTLLEINGYKAIVSDKPEKTEENIIQYDIDLVMLDMFIASVKGTDVCKRLKANKTTRDVPVLMMSALHKADHDSKEAGADGFISKPFEMEDLITKIEALLAQG